LSHPTKKNYLRTVGLGRFLASDNLRPSGRLDHDRHHALPQPWPMQRLWCITSSRANRIDSAAHAWHTSWSSVRQGGTGSIAQHCRPAMLTAAVVAGIGVSKPHAPRAWVEIPLAKLVFISIYYSLARLATLSAVPASAAPADVFDKVATLTAASARARAPAFGAGHRRPMAFREALTCPHKYMLPLQCHGDHHGCCRISCFHGPWLSSVLGLVKSICVQICVQFRILNS